MEALALLQLGFRHPIKRSWVERCLVVSSPNKAVVTRSRKGRQLIGNW